MQTMSSRRVIANMYDTFASGRHESIVRGQAPPVLSAFSQHTVWIEPGRNARSGIFRGIEEIIEHTAHCLALTDGTWGTDVVDILGDDKYVVVIERALALRNGTTLNMLCNTVYQMTNGSICEMRVLPFDPEAWDAFWS